MMQIQADVLTISLHRPKMTEVTALGAAIAAGIATDVWEDLDDMQRALGQVHEEDIFTGQLSDDERQQKWELWEWAVKRSLGWIKEGLEDLQKTDSVEKTS
jgi:glycerol kinase